MVINLESPIMYRLIAKKLLQKYPQRKITRVQAKRILGLCFKIGKEKKLVLKEMEDYGMIIFVNRQEYYINYHILEEDII